jgi:3-oxoacyl-[acyl-carrier protein] reductase
VDTGEKEFDFVMATNARGVWLVTKYVMSEMIKGGGGNIVISGSTASIRGNRHRSATAYFMSKHSVMGLVKQAALEGSRHNIRVNAVLPGFTLTDLSAQNFSGNELSEYVERIPLGRAGTPEDISNAVLFLSSDESSYITGVGLSVDGGTTI